MVKFAPQLQLQCPRLTISHAGLNTTLESLSQGVPMVADGLNRAATLIEDTLKAAEQRVSA